MSWNVLSFAGIYHHRPAARQAGSRARATRSPRVVTPISSAANLSSNRPLRRAIGSARASTLAGRACAFELLHLLFPSQTQWGEHGPMRPGVIGDIRHSKLFLALRYPPILTMRKLLPRYSEKDPTTTSDRICSYCEVRHILDAQCSNPALLPPLPHLPTKKGNKLTQLSLLVPGLALFPLLPAYSSSSKMNRVLWYSTIVCV